MNIWQSVILGVVQGLTEFLPVSSSGHLVIFQHLIPGFSQPGVLFDVTLHAGTLVAVLVYFWRDILGMVRAFFDWRPRAKLAPREMEMRRVLVLVIAGTLPVVVAGLAFSSRVETLFSSVHTVGIALFITAALLFLGDFIPVRERKQLGAFRASRGFLVGIFQSVALIPGISRSGSTIAGGLLLGLDRQSAPRYAFLLSVPAILGALVLESRHISSLTTASVPGYAAGFITAAITGYFCITLLIRAASTRRLHWFGIYCIIAGITALFIA